MKSKLTKAPMGWNSWDCFGAAVNEKQLRANAEYMAKYLKKFGYEYIVCDIQWYEPNAIDNDYNNFTFLNMDEWGRLIPAQNRFPSSKNGQGFRPIADYCHSLGLKFGIHIMRGVPRQAVHRDLPIYNSDYTARDAAHHFSVCSWNTDMYGMRENAAAQAYYDSLFELYASWGVDFIKCDDIAVTEFRKWDNPYSAYYEIEMIRKAIDKCSRDMVLSLSPGPARVQDARHLSKNANMWRMTGDFWDDWSKLYDMFSKCRQWQGVSKNGSYPDCDMLPLGRLSKNGRCHGEQNRMTKFTKDEQLTMLSLWGIFKSPLFIGGNLPENDRWTLEILTNNEFLKMHREAFGAREYSRKEINSQGEIVWTANGRHCKYVCLFNTRNREHCAYIELRDILMPDEIYTALNIWTGERIQGKNRIKVKLPPHGVGLFKIEAAVKS